MAAGSKHRQALAHLLPPGYAFPRAPESVWMCLLGGMADELQVLDEFAHQAVREWTPHLTHTRLAEWEEACGLPDRCFGTSQSEALRQAALLSRLRGAPLYYDDSSPGTTYAVEQVCLRAGATATAKVNQPFRCGRNRVGDRLGRVGVMHVVVQGVASQAERDQLLVTLGCWLEPVVPARFQILISFV